VRTVGDLGALLVPSRPPVPEVVEPTEVSTEATANLLIGMMLAAGHGMPTFRTASQKGGSVEEMGTRDLVRYTTRRVAGRVRGRLARG
jgi:hypothetical protein